MTESWVMSHANYHEGKMAKKAPKWMDVQLSEPRNGKPNLARGYACIYVQVHYGGQEEVNTACPVPAEQVESVLSRIPAAARFARDQAATEEQRFAEAAEEQLLGEAADAARKFAEENDYTGENSSSVDISAMISRKRKASNVS